MAYDDSTVERWKRNGPILGRVIARAWADDAFKQQLAADPNGVLSAEGVEIPNGVNVKVLEETDSSPPTLKCPTFWVVPTPMTVIPAGVFNGVGRL
jgi:hypothetical protein